MDITAIRSRLQSMGQEQVLMFWEQLDDSQKAGFHKQLSDLDFELLQDLVETYVKQKPPVHIPTDIDPVQAYPLEPGADQKKLYDDAEARGLELLKAGAVGAFLVAGGQGTRLGYDGPKGEYPVTPIRQKPLFQVFAEQLLAWSKIAGKSIPWYIMTSTANDARTRAFFEKHNHFGYPKGDVVVFAQGMMPAFSMDGKLLLDARDSLALSPDGHGGSLRAISKSGALADMKQRGVKHLSYFQVDNPIVHCIDPRFIGLHDLTGSEMSSKTIAKAGPLEKVGNFCIADGKLQVIEYSDLPESLAKQTNADGSLKFNAGSIAIHALSVAFIERLNAGGKLNLPWHRAEKKVPFVDSTGKQVKPETPNAVKLEQFVFDAIPLSSGPIVVETSRAEEFSPVKNAEGSDSPETSKRDQVRRAARWLKAAGVSVPMKGDDVDAVIEINPMYAVREAELVAKKPGIRIESGSSVVLD